MADSYICPVDGGSYRHLEDFVNHAVVAHDHDPDSDRDDCPCAACRGGEEPDE